MSSSSSPGCPNSKPPYKLKPKPAESAFINNPSVFIWLGYPSFLSIKSLGLKVGLSADGLGDSFAWFADRFDDSALSVWFDESTPPV